MADPGHLLWTGGGSYRTMEGVELTASAEVEIGGYHDLHNCVGSGFLGPCKPLPISHSLWTTTISDRPWHDEDNCALFWEHSHSCMHQKEGHGSMYAPCKQLCQSP